MRATLLPLVLAMACSETGLRTIYEEPPLFDQPDALGPTSWADEFQQRTVQQSDILFVVDNSCSMSDDQQSLATNFDSFISSFVGTEVDWHVGVVMGDLEDGQEGQWGRLREYGGERWVHSGTADPIAAFNSMAAVGASGSGDCEMGLEASFRALTTQSAQGAWNDGFYRDPALLSVVIVSDEVDHAGESGPLGFNSCDGIMPDEYAPWLGYNLKGPGSADRVFFTGIVGDRPGGCETGTNSADEGEGYWEVIDEMDGTFFSICSPDWGTFLYELGLEAAGMKRSFRLHRVPAEGSIHVALDGVEAVEGWSYDRVTNSVVFDLSHVPESLVVVTASYILAEDASADVLENL